MFSKRRMSTMVVASALAGVAGIAGVSDVVASPGGEVVAEGSMTVEPTTLEPGDEFEVRNDDGSECELGEVSGDTGGMHPGAWFVTPDPETGDWSVTFTVPETGPPDPMGNPTPFPPGEYEIHAFCHAPLEANGVAAPAQQQGFNYEPVTVTVTAPSQEQPTTTTTATTAPPTTPTATAPAAQAAAAQPTFTG